MERLILLLSGSPQHPSHSQDAAYRIGRALIGLAHGALASTNKYLAQINKSLLAYPKNALCE
jgi:hypothetical protein